MDGWSFQVFLKDLECHYTHTTRPYTTPQFFDYSIQDHKDFENGKLDKELTFWKTKFAAFPPYLPTLRMGGVTSHPLLTTYENKRVDIRFKSESKARIQVICRNCRVTPFHFYLAVFRVLLLRYADAKDVSVGIADANRISESTVNGIGSFVNLLPLLFHAEVTARFDDLLKETRNKAYAALDNSRVPFQVPLKELDTSGSAVRAPIFQAFVDHHLGQRERTQWANCQLEMLSFQVSKSPYDIALDVIDDPEGDCLVMLIVRKDLCNQQDAERLARSFKTLVEALRHDPSTEIGHAEMFRDAEIDGALTFSRGLPRDCSWPETVIHKLYEVAESRLTKLAVEWSDGATVTYAELLDQANSIANALTNGAAQSGPQVAVLQAPTPDWIGFIIAIVRVDAAYIPLDQGNPWSRLGAIMRDCQPSIVLVDDETQQYTDKLGVTGLKVLNVATLQWEKSSALPPIDAKATSRATILYTNGSSGVPKGIILKHEGLRNWFEHTVQVYELESERVLQQSSSGFDMSLIQIFTALCFGGCVYLVPRRHRGDAGGISELIHSQRITYTFSCTSELVTWFKYGSPEKLSGSAWRRAIIGGEPGIDALLGDFVALEKSNLRLFHTYGPTETSFTAATMELLYNDQNKISASGNVPVGYTLPNYIVYILDEYFNPMPPGAKGEIYIGGPGVAVGYLNREDLNVGRFIPN
ncbi:hypothetical protein DL766_002890 [Monosporascus sp. MC13-8B]|nr:hypothetical protein DL763_000376 [Monosporascus cannonballus]RYP34605.1 hypothetical protein DL766_002890 [Monosporascus sp. MC13-8B]